MAEVSVRPAGPSDAGEVARIQVETWQFAYAEILPPVVLEQVTRDAAEATWTEALRNPPSQRHRVLVAMENAAVVGFVAIAPADDLQPDEPEPDTTVAVGPLLVEPRWGRRGHGSRLMAAAVDLSRTDGQTRAITWIPEQDTVSREFLIGAGWALDGLVRVLDTGAGELREIRLHVLL